MSAATGRVRRLCALLPIVAALAACSGDDRAFLEAVEVRELGLVELDIVAPEGVAANPVLGVGERLDLDLLGRVEGGATVEIDDGGRDWRVADASVARIDGNGLVTGLADGTTAIEVRLGGVMAVPLTLRVSSAALTGIDRIEGPTAPDPCRVSSYSAVGTFADGSERPLADVVWRLEPAADGALRSGGALPGAIDLVPSGPGALTLQASGGGQVLERALTVPDSLSAITIPGGSRVLSVGGTLDLAATGSFDGGGIALDIEITDTVSWSVLGDSDVVSVDNLAPNAGRVTGVRAGDATVRATCAAIVANVAIGVSAGSGDDGSDEDGLAFEQGNSLAIGQGEDFQLRVSTGAEYDEDRDITNDLDTLFSSDAPNLVSVVRNGANRGRIRGLGQPGDGTLVFVRSGDESAFINVTIR